MPNRYTRTAVVLHWSIALLMVLNVALVLSVDHWPDEWARPVIDAHKSTGITVLGLVFLRIFWRLGHRAPPMLVHARWERLAAHAVHALLYLVMLALPLSGWLHDSAWKDAATHPMQLFGLMPWPRIGAVMALEPGPKEHLHDLFGLAHTLFGYVLYGLVSLHIAGALKHQWWDKQAELQRMSL